MRTRTEEFVERLTGSLDAERSTAIDDHLAGCAGCRAETDRMRELWNELGTLKVSAPSGAAGRVSRLINARVGASAPSVPPKRALAQRVAISVLALAASVVLGVIIGQRTRNAPIATPPAVASAPKERYVLLLHGPARTAPSNAAEATADSVAEQAIVAEYRAWAMGLRNYQQHSYVAEKLADRRPLMMLTANGATRCRATRPTSSEDSPHPGGFGRSVPHRASVSAPEAWRDRAGATHPADVTPNATPSVTRAARACRWRRRRSRYRTASATRAMTASRHPRSAFVAHNPGERRQLVGV